MITNQLNTRILSRNDTRENWYNVDPVLLKGELGIEIDTNKLKVGDGTTTWNQLPYLSGEGKSNMAVVTNFSDLPEVGESDVLYKVETTQFLYTWNSLTSTYTQLGQGGGGSSEEDGYVITFQNALDSPILTVLEGDSINLQFRYASVNSQGLNDGSGIGTLIVNEVKKATIAVYQGKINTLDVAEYLVLGDNNIELTVKNSDGKTKTLDYVINVVNLSLETNFKPMAIYSSAVDFSFVITGAGTKTIHYIMDNKEIYTEELTSTIKQAHTYKIPQQADGDHVFQVQAEMTVNNMTIKSNMLIIGMMFVSDSMVDTYILSTFDVSECEQSEVLTIPYMVYNPFEETTNVTLNIFETDDNNDYVLYSSKDIIVDQTPQNWVIQNYPAGKVWFQILAKSETGIDKVKGFEVDVTPSTFTSVPVASGLELEFSAAERSNNEPNPAYWSYDDIEASFERFAWSVADGWCESDSGETVLRFLPKNKMVIPFQPFATDKRTTGYTIELEMATHNVKDYDSVVLSCVHEGRGLVVKSQSIIFKSEQSKEIVMMFKEDERVRITITIEPQTLNRFIKFYINGILCGIEQYDENDNFKQATPQDITIGSDTCGLDLYKLRFYNRNLSDNEQLNNFICDRSSIAERIDAQDRNNIYDISGNLTIASLPATIPYIVMQCEELPQYKGDKKSGVSMYYVDKLRPERCFSASGCQFDVQGTSSAVYPIKNFKIKFKKGIEYNDGTTADGYPILEDGLISECLCLKADYASSEQANNVMLVDYYDELIRDYYLTPAQEEDARVRTAISGKPIVVFWENTKTHEIKFQGQYNMNNDKSNENVFGFDREKWPRTECWEFSNNTSDRTLFKRSEWEEEIYDKESDSYVPAWMSDFEARFPDLDDPYSDYTQFKRFCDFIVSTDRRQATGETLDPAVTYGDKEYTVDNAEYRLAKFKYEFENHAIKDTFIFYYLFTETFLMIDSRAKNMFLTTFDGDHWFPIPYDFDTAIGINNEGALVFEYDLEDIDTVGDENVFNGQESTLWMNVRDAFQAELFTMYDELRQSDKFAYDVIKNKMEEHQSIWPEAIWNEDAKVKYLDIYLTENEKYFEMCQGNKAAQRDWWLFNAFKYRDSKYQCGDSDEYNAFFRAYAPGDITVTPYQHLWPRVDFTDTYPVTQRSKRNVPNLLKCPLDTASDTEIFLRSADRIASFGDLSQYIPDTVKFASATKLQEIILGSSAEGYQNYKLSSVELGNNRLISYINVENCINLTSAINLSNCYNLETVKAKGSALTSINFPIGGHLTTLELPATFTNLTLRNQHGITAFSMESYDLINTIWIDDTPNLPIEELLLNTPKLDRVRIVNTEWDVTDETNLNTIYEKLLTCGGLDANGNNTADGAAVMTGRVNIDSISDELLEKLNEAFPELIVVVNGKAKFFIRYYNYNGELLYKYVAGEGDNAIDPVTSELISTPTMEPTEDTQWVYREWSSLPTNIQKPQNIIALYNNIYLVTFLNGDEQVVYTAWVPECEGIDDPVFSNLITVPTKTQDAQYSYSWIGWDKEFDIISAPTVVRATFNSILRSYSVQFKNDDLIIQDTTEFYGTQAKYHGDETKIYKMFNGVASTYYEFAGWSPDLTAPITGLTVYQAQFIFVGYIDESWDEIIANINAGNAATYGLCGRKIDTLEWTFNGKTYSQDVEFEIVGINHDTTEDGESTHLTFRAFLDGSYPINFNTKSYDLFDETGSDYTRAYDTGGWEKCDLRVWLNNEDDYNSFFNALPEALKTNIKAVQRLSDNGHHGSHLPLTETYDKIALCSLEELGILEATRYDFNEGQGTQYPVITDDTSRKMTTLVPADIPMYWTRTAGNGITHTWYYIDLDGRPNIDGASGTLCICILISI